MRIALDDWLAHGGSLPDRIRQGLAAIMIGVNLSGGRAPRR